MQSFASRRFIYNTLAVAFTLVGFALTSSSLNARSQDGRTAASYYNLALQLHKKQDFRGAVNALDRAIGLAPNEVEYHFRKAVFVYDEEEDDGTALVEINKTCSLNPNIAGLMDFKAKILGRLHRYDEALECINNAIKIKPVSPECFTTKAFLLKIQGHFQEAEDDLTAAITLSEGTQPIANFKAHLERESIAVKLGHWPLVIADSTALINNHDRSKPVLVNRDAYLFQAQALTSLKKIDQARAVYLKALAQWPDDRQLCIQARQFFDSIGDKANSQLQAGKLKHIDEDMVPLRD